MESVYERCDVDIIKFIRFSFIVASQNIACVKDDKYFVNQQIGTYREFQGRPGVVPNLFEIGNSAIVSEGISLALDINNRYHRWKAR